jgi:hypothetical protein
MRCLVEADRDGWIQLAKDAGSIRDVKGYLQYLNETLDWSCFVREVDASLDADTEDAIEAFQREYNERFDTGIHVDGICGEQTLGAVFDVLRHEWAKWLFKHNIDAEAVDALDVQYLDGSAVDADLPAAEPLSRRGCIEIIVVETSDLAGEQPTAELLYGSATAQWQRYDVPIEAWAWTRGPFTVVSDLVAGESIPPEVYTLRAMDGSHEESQTLPVDAVDRGFLQLEFLALPVDKSYELSVAIEGRDLQILFDDVPYNQLHRLAVEGVERAEDV